MKKLSLLVLIMFVIGSQASFEQTKKMSCSEIQQKIGQDKLLQLYWTEKLGEFLSVHPDIHPYKADSVLSGFGKIKIKFSYCPMTTSLGNFAFIVYDQEYDISCDDDGAIAIKTRFASRKDWDTGLDDPRLVREAYFTISKEKQFDPSQQELDGLCKKLSH